MSRVESAFEHPIKFVLGPAIFEVCYKLFHTACRVYTDPPTLDLSTAEDFAMARLVQKYAKGKAFSCPDSVSHIAPLPTLHGFKISIWRLMSIMLTFFSVPGASEESQDHDENP